VTFTLFVTGSLTDKWYFAIPLLTLIQAISGWIAHSMNHNRNPILKELSLIYAPLTAGMTIKWWGRKHNQVIILNKQYFSFLYWDSYPIYPSIFYCSIDYSSRKIIKTNFFF